MGVLDRVLGLDVGDDLLGGLARGHFDDAGVDALDRLLDLVGEALHRGGVEADHDFGLGRAVRAEIVRRIAAGKVAADHRASGAAGEEGHRERTGNQGQLLHPVVPHARKGG
ncbi:hypothetical protein D3C86_1730760 [compost metagenome]